MSKYYRLIIVVLVCAVLLFGLSLILTPQAQADGGSIEFDGRVIDLRGASSVKVESWREITAYGDVTVTTSIVTVTVWSKP